MCCCSRTECCQCCKNILKAFDCPCCRKYFPEWLIGASWWIFFIRTLVIVIFSILALSFCFLWHEQIFSTARITFGSGFILALFMTNTVFLILLYGPYLIKAYPIWVPIVITVIYLAFSMYLFIEQLIRGNLQQFKVDSILFDIWTIPHFLAGPFFACVTPFFWMFLIVTAWEIMEAYTYGFGESETFGNRAIDIGVAVIGWWMIILIFKRTRTDIPWISAMNAAGNNGEEIDWRKVMNKVCCGKYFKDDIQEKTNSQQMQNQQPENETVTV